VSGSVIQIEALTMTPGTYVAFAYWVQRCGALAHLARQPGHAHAACHRDRHGRRRLLSIFDVRVPTPGVPNLKAGRGSPAGHGHRRVHLPGPGAALGLTFAVVLLEHALYSDHGRSTETGWCPVAPSSIVGCRAESWGPGA
jgi:hypothetical protein